MKATKLPVYSLCTDCMQCNWTVKSIQFSRSVGVFRHVVMDYVTAMTVATGAVSLSDSSGVILFTEH